MSKKTDLRHRNHSIGLYKRYQAGETLRQIATSIGKPVEWVAKRIKVGERFTEQQP